jgi:hypothetical protein
MSIKVKLSLIERTLNNLTWAPRKRKGNLLERQAAEAQVLKEAFDEVRQNVLLELNSKFKKIFDSLPEANSDYDKGFEDAIAVAISITLPALDSKEASESSKSSSEP